MYLCESSTYRPESAKTREKVILLPLPETAQGESREGEGDRADSNRVLLLLGNLRVEDKEEEEEKECHGFKKQQKLWKLEITSETKALQT